MLIRRESSDDIDAIPTVTAAAFADPDNPVTGPVRPRRAVRPAVTAPAPPRVIAVDLDGTLLRTDKTVSARTVSALDRARSAGARVVVVTARPPRFVDALIAPAGLSGPAVCANGAVVYDLDTGALHVGGPLDAQTARQAAKVIESVLPGASFAVETGRHALCEPSYPDIGLPDPGRVDLPSREAMWERAQPIVKLLARARTADLGGALAQISALVPGAECTHSGSPGLIEVNGAGVTKAGALAALCAGWGVTPAEVTAFGDMPNDLPMLAWAGTAVAVANAHPAVLARVARHTAANDADGVALVLEDLFGLIGG